MATANSNSFDVRVNVPTPLAVAAAGMAPGSWATFNCNYSTVTLGALIGVGGGKRCTEYADKMAWDSGRRQIYFTGGGHGQDEKTIVYNDDTNTWTDLGRPPWFSVNPNSAVHGYQHNAFEGNTQYYLQFGTWNVRTRDVTQGNASWSSVSGPPLGGYATGALEWFPTYSGGSLVVVQGSGQGTGEVWRRTGGSWTRISGNTPMGDYHNFGVYSPVRNMMYFGGGNDDASVGDGRPNKVHTLSNTGTITERANCPARLTVARAISTVDPTTGNLVTITSDKVVRIYNPDTNTWSTGTAPPPGFWSGTIYSEGEVQGIVAAPVYDYGVTMFITIGGPAIYLRKGG